jgi:hypothetical protein
VIALDQGGRRRTDPLLELVAAALNDGGAFLVRRGSAPTTRAAQLLVQPNLFGGWDLVRPPVRRPGFRTVRPRRAVEHHREVGGLVAALGRELHRRSRGGYVPIETEHGSARRSAGISRRRLRVL